MAEFMFKHGIKIQVVISLSMLVAIVTLIWNAATYASDVNNHERRLQNVESIIKEVATKQDIQTLKQDLKDYINKQ